ncbi:MAG: cytochrome D1 domain-containing protein [Gammaproteobacteria bacterium]
MIALLWASAAPGATKCLTRGTGDLALVVERTSGSVRIFDTSHKELVFRVQELGDLSHASAVFSRDQRFAFVFGRDGGLTRVDLLCGRIDRRIIQAGNSIGGAISQDGRLVAVSNYEPGGVKIFNADTLELVADIPASAAASGVRSKVVGLVDAPGARFVYALYDAGELAMVEVDRSNETRVTRFADVGRQPYDGLITPDGRHYVAGLFGEDGMVLLDLWHPEQGVRRILGDYGRGERKLPVYKMPHLEGWAIVGTRAFFPAVGRHELLVADIHDWTLETRVPVHGQPVFAVGRPGGRQVWVNFALPHNDTLQIVDTELLEIVHTLQPGKGVLHMEFAPRGEAVWVSVRDADEVHVYDTETYERLATFEALKPSGIFFTARATRIGL